MPRETAIMPGVKCPELRQSSQIGRDSTALALDYALPARRLLATMNDVPPARENGLVALTPRSGLA